MKISVRLFLGFMAVASLIGVVGLYSLYVNQQITESFDKLKEYQEKVNAAAEASSYAKRAETHLFLYLMLDSEADKEKFFQRHTSLEEQIAILENEVVLPEVSEQVNMLKNFSAEILEYGSQLLQLHDENPETFDYKDHTELIRSFDDSSSGARKAGVTIVDLETSALNQDVEQSIKKATSLQQSMIAFIAFVVVSALGISFFIARSILTPIRKLRGAAIEISEGNLGTQIQIKSKDALGDLANSFNMMSSELKEVQEKLEEKVKERTRELRETQELLLKSERMAAIGELATMVGHDLRNPLQAIENAAYYLNNELKRLSQHLPNAQKTMEMLQAMSNSIRYADKIIADLRDFSATQTPTLKKTNINNIIQETLQRVQTPKNVEIRTVIGNIPEIEADEDKIKRVFMNLAANGIQAMENGGILTISTRKVDNFVEVSFKDSGVGIPKENMEKIFTPLFTTKAQGMGMGLAICKKFVENHGGIIQVKSEEGKGTTFTVKLPIN